MAPLICRVPSVFSKINRIEPETGLDSSSNDVWKIHLEFDPIGFIRIQCGPAHASVMQSRVNASTPSERFMWRL